MKFFLMESKTHLSYIIDTMAADDLLTKEPGHEQMRYWLSSPWIFQFQQQNDQYIEVWTLRSEHSCQDLYFQGPLLLSWITFNPSLDK